MDKDEFWALIDQTRESAGGDPDRQATLLIEALVQRSIKDILAYDEIFDEYLDNAFDAHLWNAAYLVGCGCGDDGFFDFRAWLIGQGKTIYENALNDPQSLADVISLGQDTKFAVLGYVASYAYEQKTGGEDMPITVRMLHELRGEEDMFPAGFSDEGDQALLEKYPRLRALYEYYCAHFND